MSEGLERDLRKEIEEAKIHEKELWKEIDELKSREDEIRKLRQEKEAELRNIILTREAEKIR